MTAIHGPGDPEPGPGSILRVGSAADHITFTRSTEGWMYAHNGDHARPCTYALVQWWAPLHWASRNGPRVTEHGRYLRPTLDGDTRDEGEAA
jgi:hypothetical protein